MGNYWYSAIGGANFSPIPANPVPTITVTRSGTDRILTVPSSFADYHWGLEIDSPIQSGSNSITVHNDQAFPPRCFVKDAQGNWRVTPYVYNGCPSCRDGVEETDDELGVSLKTYPNPFVKDLTIEFNVTEPQSHVRLEIINSKGQVIRTITDGIHDKGPWRYPVLNLNYPATELYFCRLKVNSLFVSKKILRAE